jgi:hypothetical protein
MAFSREMARASGRHVMPTDHLRFGPFEADLKSGELKLNHARPVTCYDTAPRGGICRDEPS